ncbi:unnamed protein product [Paramecium sonneborni]|uniref:Transmembrane protein n=1 Tax=Paramecium sonneborni TaxID=65129 RepID=A0A8S1RJE9_9CILI|nr:unnamed protein product [Paramecium sonneborni]
MQEFNSDLNLLIEQIEMLQLHASIMGPHDSFFFQQESLQHLIKYNIEKIYYYFMNYKFQQLLFYSTYNQVIKNQKKIFILNQQILIQHTFQMMQTYQFGLGRKFIQVTFRDTFYKYLQQQLMFNHLQPFIIDNLNFKFTICFNINNNNNNCLLINLIEQFVVNPFRFSLANYLIMQNTCENLTSVIKVYSQQKCNQIYLKWPILLTCFVFVFILLFILLILYYQKRYYMAYDLMIGLLRHNSDEIIQNEISRQNVLLNIISKNILDKFQLEKNIS